MQTAAIIFDLDGTLYPERALRWRMVARLSTSVHRLYRFQRLRRRDWLGKDFGGPKQYREALLQALAGTDSRRRAAWETWLFGDFWRAFLAALSHLPRQPGIIALLEELKHAGLTMAVVSDYGRVADRLRCLHIEPHLFDFLLSGEELGALKPAARIGQAVRDRLAVPLERTLWVGDRLETDGALAHALGVPYFHVQWEDAGAGPFWTTLRHRLGVEHRPPGSGDLHGGKALLTLR